MFATVNVSRAAVSDLNTALQDTYRACVGIDESLSDLKKLAGINTAVSAVGTGLGVGATAVGIAKAAKDKKIADLEKRLERLTEIRKNKGRPEVKKDELMANMQVYYDENKDPTKEIEGDIEKLTKQSKKLGNWRTGLMAGTTATNIAGAIVSTKAVKKGDVQEQINACMAANKTLNGAIMSAKLSGQDVTEANKIYTACKEYASIDASKILKHAKTARAASVVGAAAGAVGTVTSAAANSNKVRDDNTDAGKQKEKNLNTASNVLAGTATVASATATAFSATQITEIKRMVDVVQKCEGALIQ